MSGLAPFQLVASGGWVVLSILVVSVIAWVLLAGKWFALREETGGARALGERALDALRCGRFDEAAALARRDSTMTSRVLAAALRTCAPDGPSYERFLAPVIAGEGAELRRHLPLVSVLSSILPLLGLLGTVLGMLDTFSALAVVETVRVRSVADGVSQALITTQIGLLAAVPIIFVQNWLSARAESCIREATLYGKKAVNLLRDV